jgi:ectoine hydroxylase-related dioxygenase (phytanoyl-CoA dioxygenase family)
MAARHGQGNGNGNGGQSKLALATSCIVPLLVLLFALERQRLATQLAAVERKLAAYESLAHRADNPPWQEELHEERLLRDKLEESPDFVDELFAEPRRFPHGHNVSSWQAHVRESTPAAYEDSEHSLESTPAWCSGSPDLSGIVMSQDEMHPASGQLSNETRRRVQRALKECGYVYLDNMFSRATVAALREAYMALRESEEGKQMVYPCQGTGRVEHMLPFRAPFNSSEIYADRRLLTILQDYLKEQFKLELMTVITSPPGSKHQRWHQGWRYLFHPDERLPPYAVVVALPLDDVTHEMGPTEMCPGKKLRLYHGWRCNEHSIRLGSTAGTVIIFDYKTLHRGPGNEAAVERPMVSMVFSKMFFLNTEAVINRGISLVQTLHQRRYWEQFTWHPRTLDEQFVV